MVALTSSLPSSSFDKVIIVHNLTTVNIKVFVLTTFVNVKLKRGAYFGYFKQNSNITETTKENTKAIDGLLRTW